MGWVAVGWVAVGWVAVAVASHADAGRPVRFERGERSLTVTAPDDVVLSDAAMVDDRRIVAVGYRCRDVTGVCTGVILVSVDGGRTFAESPDLDLPRLDRVAVTSSRAGRQWTVWGDWSHADRASQYVSRDGGRSWKPADQIEPPPGPQTAWPTAAHPDNRDEPANVAESVGIADPDHVAEPDLAPELSVITTPDQIPWADLAIASLAHRWRVRLHVIHHPGDARATDDDRRFRDHGPNDHRPNDHRPNARWSNDWEYRCRAALTRCGVGEVTFGRRPVLPPGRLWVQADLAGVPPSATRFRIIAIDAESTQANVETLIASLGKLRSDFVEDAFRLIDPTAPVARRVEVVGGGVLTPPVRGGFSTSRHQLQIASARLPRRGRVAELLTDYAADRIGDDELQRAIDTALTRTGDDDHRRLAWMMVRMAWRSDHRRRSGKRIGAPVQRFVRPHATGGVADWIDLQSQVRRLDPAPPVIRPVSATSTASTASPFAGEVSTAGAVARPGLVARPGAVARPGGAIPIGLGTGPTPRYRLGGPRPSAEATESAICLQWEYSPAKILASAADEPSASEARLSPLIAVAGSPWQRLLGPPATVAPVTPDRPRLDGVDDEWIGEPPPAAHAIARVMVDDEYLYVAAATGMSVSDSGGHHRDGLNRAVPVWQLSIDVDGDLQQPMRFLVAADGTHGEHVGGDWSYNPTWYVAHRGDRIELAIRRTDLVGLDDAPERPFYLRADVHDRWEQTVRWHPPRAGGWRKFAWPRRGDPMPKASIQDAAANRSPARPRGFQTTGDPRR